MPGLSALFNSNKIMPNGSINPLYQQWRGAKQQQQAVRQPLKDQYKTMLSQAQDAAKLSGMKDWKNAFEGQYGREKDFLMANPGYMNAMNNVSGLAGLLPPQASPTAPAYGLTGMQPTQMAGGSPNSYAMGAPSGQLGVTGTDPLAQLRQRFPNFFR